MAENNELVEAGEEQEMDKVPASKSFMPSSDIMRQIIIVVALAVCLAVVVYLIFLAKAPEMRPLGQYDSDDLVKVLDMNWIIPEPAEPYMWLQMNIRKFCLS